MMKCYLLFISFCSIPIVGFSQVPTSNINQEQITNYIKKASNAIENKHFDSIYFYIEKANVLSQSLEDVQHLGSDINKTGKILKDIGALQECIDLLQTYIPKMERQLTNTHAVTAKMYAYLGDAYRKQGRYSEALKWLEKSLKNFEALEIENLFVAHILRHRANLYSQSGNSLQALEILKESIAIYKKTQSHQWMMIGLMDMGVAYNNIWESTADTLWRDKALVIYQNVRNINQQYFENENSIEKARLLINEADTKSNTLSAQELIIIHKKVLIIFESNNQIDYTIEINISIGDLYLKLNQKELAYTYYQKALQQAQKIYHNQKHRFFTKIYTHIGHYYSQKENYQQALKNYQKGLTALFPNFHEQNVSQNPPKISFYSEPWIMEVLINKAQIFHQIYQKQGKQKENLEFALQCIDSAFNMVRFLQQSYDRDAPKHMIRSHIHHLHETAIQINLTLYAETQSTHHLEKAFAYADQSRGSLLREVLNDVHAKKFSGIPEHLIKQERNIKKELAYYEKQLHEIQLTGENTTIPIIEDSLFTYRKQLNQFVEQLEQKYPKYHSLKYADSPLSLPQIQKKLSPQQTLIEYFVGDSILYSFVLTNEDIRHYTQPIPKDFSDLSQQSNGKVKQFLNSINQPSANNKTNATFVKKSHELYQLLLEKPLNDLADKDIQQLLIIPDNVLGYIPFDVLLYDSIDYTNLHAQKPYLLQKYSIGYAFSAALFSKETTSPSPTTSFGGFAPIYEKEEIKVLKQLQKDSTNLENILVSNTRGDIGDLEWARITVNQLASLMNGDKWLEHAASEKNFKMEAPNYDILHLAMHGYLDSHNPLYSKLVFTLTADTLEEDNFLTAAEIYNLQLNADLAVLSACQTGEGEFKKGEGIMSLARAFAYAGCPSMVMSLWSVPDKETGELMVYFYEELKAGETKDVALRKAKLRYLEAHQADKIGSHPYHWAAFVPIGDMDAMKIEGGGIEWWMWLILLVGLTFGIFFGLKKYFGSLTIFAKIKK